MWSYLAADNINHDNNKRLSRYFYLFDCLPHNLSYFRDLNYASLAKEWTRIKFVRKFVSIYEVYRVF